MLCMLATACACHDFDIEGGYMGHQMALYGCKCVKFGFSLKSYCRRSLNGFKVCIFDCPRKVNSGGIDFDTHTKW